MCLDNSLIMKSLIIQAIRNIGFALSAKGFDRVRRQSHSLLLSIHHLLWASILVKMSESVKLQTSMVVT